MRHAILILAVPGLILLSAEFAAAQEAGADWVWGVAAGLPQTIALTLERRLDSPVGFQVHAGTVVAASSAGMRLLLRPSNMRVAPYAFVGGGVFHTAEGESGGGVGATGFGWAGAGLRLSTGPLSWFVEIGGTWGRDTSKEYESSAPAGAVGVAFGAH